MESEWPHCICCITSCSTNPSSFFASCKYAQILLLFSSWGGSHRWPFCKSYLHNCSSVSSFGIYILTQSEKVNPIWVPNLAFMAPQHKAWPQRPFGLAQISNPGYPIQLLVLPHRRQKGTAPRLWTSPTVASLRKSLIHVLPRCFRSCLYLLSIPASHLLFSTLCSPYFAFLLTSHDHPIQKVHGRAASIVSPSSRVVLHQSHRHGLFNLWPSSSQYLVALEEQSQRHKRSSIYSSQKYQSGNCRHFEERQR